MLHHYDKIGLLSPGRHSDSGHRLYTEADVARLQQIISFKQLGFALEEIKEQIENPNFDPVEVIKIQLESVKEQIRLQKQLLNRLENIYELINTRQKVTTEQFIELMEVINMNNRFTKQFSKNLSEYIKKKMSTGKKKPMLKTN